MLGEAGWLRLKLLLGRRPPAGPPGLRVRPGGDGPRARLASVTRAADLATWAWHYGTDKWGVHWYAPHYERHLAHLRHEPITLFEIGVGGWDLSAGGESLRMWQGFLPRARIVGLDIVDKTALSGGRITVRQGSQVDESVLRQIVTDFGPLQVVIDDGSHRPEHVRETFRILWPLLPDGAVYAIEDIQTTYWPTWGGSLALDDPTTSMGLVKELIDGLNHEEILGERAPLPTDSSVRAVHCYHNLVIIEKGENLEGSARDAIADLG